MSSSKVVRVEDVLETAQSFITNSQIQLLDNEGNLEKKSSDESSLRAMDSLDGEHREMLEEEEENEEEEDKVYALPENWPYIPQVKRPRSCALTMSRMPCVRKAVSHLELIQNIIEAWFKEVLEKLRRRSSARSSASSMNASKKELRFDVPAIASGVSSGLKMPTLTTSQQLTVTGAAFKETEAADLEIPYLGAEDVIDEVITLLARLETDRQDTQKRLLQERETIGILRKKIDDLCLRRQKELPALVQREHEAYLMNISELQWHLAYTARHLARVRNRKDTVEALNRRLKEDIKFIKNHIPLVEEKLQLEMEAMDMIKKAQVETNQELMTTEQRLAKTALKSSEAGEKAKTERFHIRKELDNAKAALRRAKKELSQAERDFANYISEIYKCNQQLQKNLEDKKLLEVKVTSAKHAEKVQLVKIETAHTDNYEAEKEFRSLQVENLRAEEELESMKGRTEDSLDELLRQIGILEESLQALRRENLELTVIVEELESKVKKCEDMKAEDEKAIRRIQREMLRIESLIQATTEELVELSILNERVRSRLNFEMRKAFLSEEALKETLGKLRQQKQVEEDLRLQMDIKVKAVKSEIDKTQTEAKRKKEKALKVLNEIQGALHVVEAKVQSLHSVQSKMTEEKSKVKSQLEKLQSQHELHRSESEHKLSSIASRHDELQKRSEDMDEEVRQLLITLDEKVKEAKILARQHNIKIFSRPGAESPLAASPVASITRPFFTALTTPEVTIPALSTTVAIYTKPTFAAVPSIVISSTEPDYRVPSYSEGIPVVAISTSAPSVVVSSPVDPSAVTLPAAYAYEMEMGKGKGDIKFPGLRLRRAVSDSMIMPSIPVVVLRKREAVRQLDNRLKYMTEKSAEMKEAIAEINVAEGAIIRATSSVRVVVKELKVESEAVKSWLRAVQKIGNDLMEEYAAVTDRYKEAEKKHTAFMFERRAVLSKHEDDKRKGLQKNKALAARYRLLHYEFLVLKEKMLRSYDERLELEYAISDIKTIRRLQSRLHGSLAEFFELSGMYLRGELNRLESDSAGNSIRVAQLQKDMAASVSLITTFLTTQILGPQAQQMSKGIQSKRSKQKKEAVGVH